MKMISPDSLRSPAQGRARLMRLAEFLETRVCGELTFARWYGMEAGCAVGLAIARDPWFRNEGLRLLEADGFGDIVPVYNGQSDWPAICGFFELDMEDAEALFTAEGYGRRLRPNPREIAAKIRVFLRQRGLSPVSRPVRLAAAALS